MCLKSQSKSVAGGLEFRHQSVPPLCMLPALTPAVLCTPLLRLSETLWLHKWGQGQVMGDRNHCRRLGVCTSHTHAHAQLDNVAQGMLYHHRRFLKVAELSLEVFKKKKTNKR